MVVFATLGEIPCPAPETDFCEPFRIWRARQAAHRGQALPVEPLPALAGAAAEPWWATQIRAAVEVEQAARARSAWRRSALRQRLRYVRRVLQTPELSADFFARQPAVLQSPLFWFAALGIAFLAGAVFLVLALAWLIPTARDWLAPLLTDLISRGLEHLRGAGR